MRIVKLMLCCSLALLMASAPAKSKEEGQPQVDTKKVSEAFGYFIGQNLRSPDSPYELESVIKGMKLAQEGDEEPDTENSSVIVGYLWASGFKAEDSPIKIDAVIRGIRMAADDLPPPMKVKEFEQAMEHLGEKGYPKPAKEA